MNSSLLPLRQDLRLFESGVNRHGAPQWTIQDPVRNRFFRIGWLEYECLLHWSGTPARVAKTIARTTPLAIEEADVLSFAGFLSQNQLLQASSTTLSRTAEQSNKLEWRQWRWWLHHYLFFRIPLVRPQFVLQKILPWLRPLLSVQALALLLIATTTGLLLVARQWDVFIAQVSGLLMPASIPGFLLAIIFSKFLHEMGHALVATHLGLRVSHMGIAFMVLWPMLYTDTSESWRLPSPHQRLAISVAGVASEIALAGIATLLWGLLEDGALRQAMLYLATTGWILSLALNISPFMRFDGYFVLSDLLDFPNLHERAGAVARAWLRRLVLGLDTPCPEPLPSGMQRGLVIFALATWFYRALLFIGIAVAVYVFFFKALGIFLLCVELLWFLVLPIFRELKVWRESWPLVRNSRRIKLFLSFTVIMLPLVWPLDWQVKAPAVARPSQEYTGYALQSGQLVSLQAPGPVAAGTVLMQLHIPALEARGLQVQASIESLNRHLGGLSATPTGSNQAAATRGMLERSLAISSSVNEETAQLLTKAPFDGIWVDVDPVLRAGSWIELGTSVGMLVNPGQWIVEAYVDENDVSSLDVGAASSFLPDGHWSSIPAVVVDVAPTRASSIEQPMLESRHGGSIQTTQLDNRNAVPTQSLYRVTLQLNNPPPSLKQTRGRVSIQGHSRSLVWQALQSAMAVLIRESGF